MAWKNDQVSETETKEILKIAHEEITLGGDFVEMGCYKGDTSLLIAEILRGTGRKLFIYDSFEGLPEKTVTDSSEIGKDFQAGALVSSKRELKQRFLRAGLPVPVIKKGWFAELKETDIPAEIAFAFLDGDFYSSIKDSLSLVENKMQPGGVIIVHDYSNAALPGVAKAVDEWLLGRNLQTKVCQTLIEIFL